MVWVLLSGIFRVRIGLFLFNIQPIIAWTLGTDKTRIENELLRISGSVNHLDES